MAWLYLWEEKFGLSRVIWNIGPSRKTKESLAKKISLAKYTLIPSYYRL